MRTAAQRVEDMIESNVMTVIGFHALERHAPVDYLLAVRMQTTPFL